MIRNSFKYLASLLLLPLFFLLSNWSENFGIVDIKDVLQSGLELLAIGLTCFLVSFFITRKPSAAFVLGSFFTAFILFYGAIADSLHVLLNKSNILSYSILFPLWLVVFLALASLVRRAKERMETLSKFLVIFFSALALVSLIQLGVAVSRGADYLEFGDKKGHYARTIINKRDSSVSKPDIYWIVLDEYPSSKVLKDEFKYENELDGFLQSEEFQVVSNAQSAYNYTHYSLNSELDMNYLDAYTNDQIVSAKDIARGIRSLRSTNTFILLKQLGYSFQNHTIYPIDSSQFKGYEMFQFLGVKLFTHQLWYRRVGADIGWLFRGGAFKNELKRNQSLNKEVKGIDQEYNEQLRSWNTTIDIKEENHPKFAALHLMLPHEPFIYDANGKLHLNGGLQAPAIPYFTEQLKYTNSLVKQMVMRIKANHGQRPYLIIIQGDHGFKFEESNPLFKTESFSTYLALYSSEKKSHHVHDGINLVNLYRAVFTDYLGYSIDSLPNKQFLLRYR